MAASVRKAMILTAGLGTRLNPISQKIPKPLVPVLNIPNILHILFLLKRAGVTDVVMNLFHLPKEMAAFFSKKNFGGLNYSFTHENPILGTGGGVKNAEAFLSDSRFILVNCDFVTNIDIKRFVDQHVEKNSKASMILIQDPSRQHLYSKVGIDQNDHLVQLPKMEISKAHRHGIFTGIHILEPSVFDLLENKTCGINDVLYPALMKSFPQSVHGFIDTKGFWYDTGDLPAFLTTSHHLLQQLTNENQFLKDILASLDIHLVETQPKVWVDSGSSTNHVKLSGPILIGKNVTFGKNVQVGPFTVIGDNCCLEDFSCVENSVLLPNSFLSAGTRLLNSIQFENLSLSAKSIV